MFRPFGRNMGSLMTFTFDILGQIFRPPLGSECGASFGKLAASLTRIRPFRCGSMLIG